MKLWANAVSYAKSLIEKSVIDYCAFRKCSERKGGGKLYSIEELEIIKSALEQDIIHQKKQLEEVVNDIRFELWLFNTEDLYKKVTKDLAARKGRKHLIQKNFRR